jgi:hypothetical protein
MCGSWESRQGNFSGLCRCKMEDGDAIFAYGGNCHICFRAERTLPARGATGSKAHLGAEALLEPYNAGK